MEHLHSAHKALGSISSHHKTGCGGPRLAAQPLAETEASGIHSDDPWLCSKFKVTVGYVRGPYLKNGRREWKTQKRKLRALFS